MHATTPRGARRLALAVDQRQHRVDGAQQRVHRLAVGVDDRFGQREERPVQQPRYVCDQQRGGHRLRVCGRRPQRCSQRQAARAPAPYPRSAVEHPAVFAPHEAVGPAHQRGGQVDRRDAPVDDRPRPWAIALRLRPQPCADRRVRAGASASLASQRCAHVRRCWVARSGAFRIPHALAPLPASSAVTKSGGRPAHPRDLFAGAAPNGRPARSRARAARRGRAARRRTRARRRSSRPHAQLVGVRAAVHEVPGSQSVQRRTHIVGARQADAREADYSAVAPPVAAVATVAGAGAPPCGPVLGAGAARAAGFPASWAQTGPVR